MRKCEVILARTLSMGVMGLKKIGLVFVVILLGAGVFLYYLWSQATNLPEWYTNGSTSAAEGSVIFYGENIETIEKKLRQKIESQIKKTAAGKKVEIELDENDTNTLIASMVVKSSKNHKSLRAIKASKTSIKEGNLDFGIVVNASDIIEDIREEETVKTGPSIINIPGFFKDKEVYLGLLGKYGLKNGQLKLDPDGKIRIGALSFSMSNALKKLGISEARVRRAIKDLKIGKLKIDDIEVVKNRLQLKGSFN
jgi:hypothetical protein